MPGSTVTTLPASRTLVDSWRQARILVDDEADAVPQAVAERVPVAGRVDPVARARSRLPARTRRPNCLERRELRVETHLVRVLQLVREAPGGERPRAVRAVAVDHAARVDDQRSHRAR